MNRLRADALLLLTAMIWGSAFIAQKTGNETMPPIAFVAVRFLLSAIVLAPFALLEAQRAAAPLNRRHLLMALAVGLCLFTGGILQQVAMVTASATHGGFLTALYVVLVPFSTWLLTRERIRPMVLMACVVSISGAYLLTSGSLHGGWSRGDTLLVVSDFAWAFWISLIGIFQRYVQRPYFLAFMQFAITAAIAIPLSLVFEDATWPGLRAALPELLFTGLVSGGLAFTIQILAQRHTPPAEAALIMSLESVFAAIAGALIFGERLTPLALMGCALILAGVMAAEVIPALRKRAAPS
jgi:drug/metabolite transporter (DMT)-like permease